MTATAAKTYQLYINGQWAEAAGGKTFEVRNPATGELIANVADGGAAEAEAAVKAAHEAFPAWSKRPADERAELLHKAFDILKSRIEEHARILTQENGKPLAESKRRGDDRRGLRRWNAEEARRTYGEVVPSPTASQARADLPPAGRRGRGDHPLELPVLDDHPQDRPGPGGGLHRRAAPLLGDAAGRDGDHQGVRRCGLPGGRGQHRHQQVGDRRSSKVLAESKLVRKITFTGSTEVGKQLMAQAAGTVKKVSLELGGHAPMLIFDDADLEAAAQGAITSRFRNAGQTCICTNRLYVQRSIVDKFSKRVAELAGGLKVGNGLDAGDAGRAADRRARLRQGRGSGQGCGRRGRAGAGRWQARRA